MSNTNFAPQVCWISHWHPRELEFANFSSAHCALPGRKKLGWSAAEYSWECSTQASAISAIGSDFSNHTCSPVEFLVKFENLPQWSGWGWVVYHSTRKCRFSPVICFRPVRPALWFCIDNSPSSLSLKWVEGTRGLLEINPVELLLQHLLALLKCTLSKPCTWKYFEGPGQEAAKVTRGLLKK